MYEYFEWKKILFNISREKNFLLVYENNFIFNASVNDIF